MKRLFRLLQLDGCPALQNKNPFLPSLIIEESRWGGLAARCDAFDAEGSRSAELLEALSIASRREDLDRWNRGMTRSLPCFAKDAYRPFLAFDLHRPKIVLR